MEEARQVMAQTASQTNGEFPLPKYVLLLTDGDPNCTDGAFGQSPDRAAQQATIDAIADLASDGVLTYVVGFQTGSTSFASVLDEMAQNGGTGDDKHRSVNSGDELLDEFRRIAGSAVSCSFVLGQQVDKTRVEVHVNGALAPYGTGWNIRPDGKTIDLLGETCDALQSGALVEAEVFCSHVRID